MALSNHTNTVENNISIHWQAEPLGQRCPSATCLIDGDSGAVRWYILLWDFADGDSEDTVLSLATYFTDISIFWQLELALESTKASLLLLLLPVHIHFLLLAFTADNELAILVDLYLEGKVTVR